MRRWAWFDYARLDRPNASRCDLAADAMIYLSLEDGAWRRNQCAIIAVLGYANTQSGQSSTPQEMKDLVGLLRADPVNTQAVRDWFRTVYPSLA